jgi:hypothetical protein
MITPNIAKIAISIAQEFDKRRLVIEPVVGTPLASLVNSSDLFDVTPTAEPSNGVAEYHPDPETIAFISSSADEGTLTQHDIALSDMTSDIAASVKTHINFAKNTVRPIIEEVVKAVESAIASLPVNLEYNLNIVQVDLPEPMVSAAFEDMVRVFENVLYSPLGAMRMSLPSKSGFEVIESLVTGAKDTDEAIAVWAAKKGDAYFANLWSLVFTAEANDGRFDTLLQDSESGSDLGIAVFLLCKRLYDAPPEGVSMSLADFNEKIALIRDQAALRVVHAYEEYARNTSMGLVIRSIKKNEVHVNGNVYRTWLENGGSNAVLFGSLLSDRPEKYVLSLDEKRVELQKTWEQHNHILTVSERNRQFINYKSILRHQSATVMGSNLVQCFGEVANGREVTTDLPEYVKCLDLMNAFVDAVTDQQFKDLWTLCTQLVCRGAFYYTDAEKILIGIERACKDNAGIEIREAALLSLVEYVTDYVCNQMKLSGV